MWAIAISLITSCDDTLFSSHEVIVEGEGYDAVVQVFQGNCLGSCHGAGATFPDLETDPCSTLPNEPSLAYDGILVVPGDASESVLWHKITDSGQYGGLMPAGATSPMPQSNIDIITDWINAGAQCNADTDTDAPDTGDTEAAGGFVSLYDDVISTQCLGCHSTASAFGGLTLEPLDDAFDTLTTAAASTGTAYVSAGNPASSYLYLKVTADPSIAGGGMPSADGLDSDGRQQVYDWIADGALYEADTDAPDTGDTDTIRFSDIYEPVFFQCVDSCHDSVFEMGGLVLEPEATAWTNLINGDRDGAVYVEASNPGSSYLYWALTADDRAGYPMPNADGATPEERQLVRQWIRDGALE